MGKIIKLLYCIFIITSLANAQNDKCSRITHFGTKEICLPNIKNYKECYTYSTIKQFADRTEHPSNLVLGFYLNDKGYEKKDSFGIISFNDYFKVYSIKQFQNYNANKSTLEEMKKGFNDIFISKKWEEVDKAIEELNLEVEIGRPVLIKNYNLNDSSFINLCILKNKSEESTFVLACSINGLLINNRLICIAYFLIYKDENTLKELEEKSNIIINEFLNSNKN